VSGSLNYLRLNVGHIIHQNVGISRDLKFDSTSVHLPPDLDLINLAGSAQVTKTTQGLLFRVVMQAEAIVECVCCLENYSQPLEIDFTELYAFSADSMTDSGLLLPEDGMVDLLPLIREEMLLAVPIRPICRVDCKGLCFICGENLNESQCNHGDEPIDPRLEILRSLLTEDNNS
jgi:uncharacterized protein